jgi:CYTH domain-containing protein
MRRLIAEISSFLGEPAPFEIERKYLIEYPDLEWLQSIPSCEKVDIIQIYLKVDENEEIRVRQRGSDGHYIYYLTRKIRINEHKHLKTERRISENEYLNLIMNADASLGRIRKERYCLAYNNQYFQIDVYPFWKDKALAEIEMYDVSDEVFFPEQIKVIKEVTDDPEYKNAALAKHRPE